MQKGAKELMPSAGIEPSTSLLLTLHRTDSVIAILLKWDTLKETYVLVSS
jgi:hypothetical protein